ncbi:DinB family protein [Sanyastnella coralliicola]|uniref:DinB family protein n=1 Tax=Sanyastnella coralliicola TaxID=3069118 RepID=UPI0027B97C35|nr:DinB family protein [Longitalea sp. SCSIO 12813]
MPLTENFDSYFQRYIDLAGSTDPSEALQRTSDDTKAYLSPLSEEQWHYAYAEGKWTVADMLQHMIDTERIMAYRALHFARSSTTPLHGFDHDLFVANAEADKKNGEDILNDFLATRVSTMSMFGSFNVKRLDVSGSFDSRSPLTVRQLGLLISGHNIHHLNVLKDRYFNSGQF